MNVKEIVLAYLKGNGYDGLFEEDGECACGTDDLMPCSEPGVHCRAGHWAPCDCGGHDSHIAETKENTP